MKKPINVFGHDLGPRGELLRRCIDISSAEDYGFDPMGNGTYKMVPSGDIVGLDERNRRLGRVYDA